MKKSKILGAAFLALVATIPCFAPEAHAMMSATKPKSVESGSSSDITKHQIFLEEFRELANSCIYDPYFDYESEESEIMGCVRQNSAQIMKLPKKAKEMYLRKVRDASLKIVRERHHGFCRHFSSCVVELCKKYGIEFKVLTTRHQDHSAVAYCLGDDWYVADMLLQVARNHNFTVDEKTGARLTSADEMERYRKNILESALGIIKAKKPVDPVTASLDVKGIEFGRVPIGIYLNYVAIPGDINITCDEYFRAKEAFPTPPKY